MIEAVRSSETSVHFNVTTWRYIRALMIEAVRSSETSVHFNVTTRRYIPEDSINFIHAAVRT
jgi:hypothetical protein